MHYDWKELCAQITACQACELCKTRNNVVIGEGDIHAQIFFIGEGPGRDEDRTGRPFVGAAGQLLDQMMQAIGPNRSNAYIANIVKCRPPQNRAPLEHEAEACLPFLRAQFALIRPKIIVCLGATSAKYIYDPQVRITQDRGTCREHKGIWIIPTYHPAALLREPARKREAWVDLQAVRDKLAINWRN